MTGARGDGHIMDFGRPKGSSYKVSDDDQELPPPPSPTIHPQSQELKSKVTDGVSEIGFALFTQLRFDINGTPLISY